MIAQTQNFPCRQKGIVLLGIVILFALTMMTYFLSGLSVVEIKQYKVESTAKSLQRAKQALIAYAVTYGDLDADVPPDGLPDFPGEYGFLPCPDYNNGLAEGLEDNGNCGVSGLAKLGFFPWKTLDLPALRDASGNCLLYAVTGEYKNDEGSPSQKTQMLNEDTNGMFQIIDNAGVVMQGGNPEDRIVAIIFAPGKVLPGQSRDFTLGSFCGNDYANFNAYLENGGGADNSDVSIVLGEVDQFIHATAASVADNNPNPYNDTFVTITRNEIWSAIVKRTDMTQKMVNLTEGLAMCLRDYAIANLLNRLPWPVAMAMADYRVNSNYDDNISAASGYAGRFPFIVDSSNNVIPGANLSDELAVEAGCNALVVSSGATVDLITLNSEYRVLWENWKDHFFYVVSNDYAPALNATPAPCIACITVGIPGAEVQRAAMVVFSPRQIGQVRNEPVGLDTDTKFDINNYMVNGNGGNFPDVAGSGNYSTTGTNDIMYCITTVPPSAPFPAPPAVPTVVQC